MKHRSSAKKSRARARHLFEALERRQLLSTATWINTAGGSWNTPANWSTGVVPQPADNVIINQPGGIQVALSGSALVASLNITGDGLNVSGGTLSLSAASSIGTSATLTLTNATVSLTSGASLTNSGSIIVASAGVLNVGSAYTATSTGAVSFVGGVTGTNLVTDPGFESPSVGNSTTTGPSGWGQWGSSYISTSPDHTGAQSLVQSGSNSGVFQSFPVTAGGAYTLSLYALNPAGAQKLAGDQGGFLNISFQNASGGSLSTGGQFDTVANANSSAGSWVNYSEALTPPVGATSMSMDLQIGPYVYGYAGTAGGSVYWDDVSFGLTPSIAGIGSAASISNGGSISIGAGAQFTDSGAYVESSSGNLTLQPGTQATGVGTNYVGDSGFESPALGGSTDTTTSPTNWGTWGSTYVSSQYALSGSQSLLQYNSNSGASQAFAVTPGVSYTISANALNPATNSATGISALSGSQGGFLNVSFSTSAGTGINSPSEYVNLVNANSAVGIWVNSTTQFTAPAGAATINIALQAQGGTGISGTQGGDVFWDNIQLGPTAITSASIKAASVTNSGTITLGVGDTFTDSGSFTQTTTGIFISQLGGPAAGNFFGSLTAGGSASLAGALQATLVNGYSPSINDGFSVLSYTSVSGTFASYQLPSGSSYIFQPGVNPTYSAISAVPPSITTTVAAGTTTTTASSNFVGTNLAYWDGYTTSTQTQQLVQAAGLGLLRFPGGSGSDDYHFNVADNYGYGTISAPQFVQFISQVNATGLVTVDYGSGSPQEGEAELAYFEGSPTDTTVIGNGIEWSDSANAWQNVNWQTVGYWAGLRAAKPLGTDDGLNFLRLNHSAGFINIKYWEMGNETYYPWETDHHGTAGPNGSTGAIHDAATYATFTASFAKFVAGDLNLPRVVTGIGSANPVGANDGNLMQTVLTDLYSDGVVPGFLSDHVYMQNAGSESDPGLLNNTVSDPASLLDWSTRYADYESILQQVVGSANAATVKIMATEFNSTNGELGKQSTSLVDGLFVADSIGSLLNSGYSAGLVWDLSNGYDANGNDSSQLYGWREGGDFGIIGAGQNTPPSTAPYVAYPAYYAEQLASHIMQNGGLDVSTSGSYGELETYTVLEPNGHLDLMVLNKNPDSILTGQFNLSGFNPTGQAQLWQYGEAQDYAQSQSSTGASALTNSSISLALNGNNFSYNFPAYSMTVIDLTNLPVIAAAVNSTLTITLNNIAPISVGTSGSNVVVSELGEKLSFAGITSIVVNGSNVTDTLNFTGPQTTPFTFANSTGTTLNVNSGNLTLAAGTGPAINVQSFSGISISATAGIITQAAASTALRTLINTQTLTIAGSTGNWTGKLDLNANDIVISAGSLPTISDQLKQGYNSIAGGNWEGNGGIISSAAATDASHLTGLGVALNSVDGTLSGAALYGSGTLLGTFDGTSPAASAVLVKYTYYGDANLSGTVDGSDYTRIDSGYLQHQTGWFFGDFNYDGVVNGSDYTLVDNAFNTQGAAITAEISLAASNTAVQGQVSTLTDGLLVNRAGKSPVAKKPENLLSKSSSTQRAPTAEAVNPFITSSPLPSQPIVTKAKHHLLADSVEPLESEDLTSLP